MNLEDSKQRLEYDIYSGFLMKLFGHNISDIIPYFDNSITIEEESNNDYLLYSSINNPTKKHSIVYHDIGYDNVEDGAHFVYYDHNGKQWDAYTLQRQRQGGHQFCQIHSLLLAMYPEYRVINNDDVWQTNTKEAYYQIIDFFVQYLDKVFKKLGKPLLLESLEIIENEQYNDPNEIPFRTIIEKIFTNLKELINKGKYIDLKYDILTILTTTYSVTEAIYM